MFLLRDLWDGAGWGVLDVRGRPKSAYDAMARACAPRAVLLTDEGLNGLHAHLMNDVADPFDGTLRVRAFGLDGNMIASAEETVAIPANSAVVRSIDEMLGSFRDLNYVYRFGPRAYDVVAVQLLDGDGTASEVHHLPGGHQRPTEPDLGLRACGRPVDDIIELRIETDRFAQFVSIDIPFHIAEENWFHLAPGDARTVTARRNGDGEASWGEVRALNMAEGRAIRFTEDFAR